MIIYFKTAIPVINSKILFSFGYGFFAYYMYTLEYGFKIAFSKDYSDISLYIFFLFGAFDLSMSALLVNYWINYKDFFRSFSKFNQILFITC